MKVYRALTGVCVLAASACSFTEGFDGFAGSSATRNSPSTEDGAITENSDSGDGISTVDGRSDGGDGGAVDPNSAPYFVDGGSFCSTQTTTFCEDFDTQDLGKNWLREGAYGKLTSYTAKSAPNDFLLNAPATAATGTFVSKITHDFDTNATSTVLTFDLFPEETYLGTSFFILSSMEWTRADAKYSLRLVYSSGRIRLEESNLVAPPNNKDEYHPFFDLAVGKWSRLSLDVVASGSTPGAQLSADGVPIGTRETLTPTAGMDLRPTLILGAVFAGQPHTGWVLRYDNVTVTFR